MIRLPISDYKTSLKLPEAEELLDLALFRPIAFLLVKVIYRLPVTPNQITLLSMLAGFAAAWGFSQNLLVAAACWYCASNILDCADGQLARLQGSGTPAGRALDGAADYVSSVAIFLGLIAAGNNLWLVAACGASSALHAFLFDHYQSRFLAKARGQSDFFDREIEKFTDGPDRTRESDRSVASRLLLWLYVRYSSFQKKLNPPDLSSGMMRMWSFLGPTTNRSLLMAAALFGNVNLYLWAVPTVGNLWLLSCRAIQHYNRGKD